MRLIAVGQRFFDKHGAKAVFLARWVALVRIAAAWLAGINKMKFRDFFFWNALGGITWATTYGLVGYYGGKAAADAITRYGVIAAIVLAVAIVVALIAMKVRERRAGRRPESESEGAAEPGKTRRHRPSRSPRRRPDRRARSPAHTS